METIEAAAATGPDHFTSELERTAATYGYRRGRPHPRLRTPLIQPPGWDDLALAASVRVHLEIPQAALAVAMRRHPSDVSAWECGRVKAITQKMLFAYVAALDQAIDALEEREARVTGKVRELASIANQAPDPGAWVDRLLDQVEAGDEGGRHA